MHRLWIFSFTFFDGQTIRNTNKLLVWERYDNEVLNFGGIIIAHNYYVLFSYPYLSVMLEEKCTVFLKTLDRILFILLFMYLSSQYNCRQFYLKKEEKMMQKICFALIPSLCQSSLLKKCKDLEAIYRSILLYYDNTVQKCHDGDQIKAECIKSRLNTLRHCCLECQYTVRCTTDTVNNPPVNLLCC